jgi:hypothetical protein
MSMQAPDGAAVEDEPALRMLVVTMLEERGGVEQANVNLLVKPFSPDERVAKVAELTGGEGR